MKKISLFAVLLAGILGISFASAQGYSCPMEGYGGMMYGSYGTGAMTFGWLISILVIVLIIAAIYWLIKSANRK